MCVTIFGLTVCVTRAMRAAADEDWYPGREMNTVEQWREEAQHKALRFR